MASQIASLLESSRKELLELGLRNNSLINHRLRAKQITVVEEKSKEIYRILVTEGRSMTFDALPDTRKNEYGDDALEDIRLEDGATDAELSQPDFDATDVDMTARYTDSKLQTVLGTDKLQPRLLSVHNDARTYIEEQGVNILYMALGFLHWRESKDSTEPRRAPLVLIPVELKRSSAQSRFQVRHTGGDIGDNLSLVEKLKSEFVIDLPRIDFSDDSEFELDDYYERVSTSVDSSWHVEPDEMTIGFFSFGKFLMYQDLDPAHWEEEHSSNGFKVMKSLLVSGFDERISAYTEDTHIDKFLEPSDVHQVLDADSSQILAIQDVLNGRNLVIQGPPGTGKSQTITNLIAEFVGKGKKVLFVSEKMAALEVVKRRLDTIGIGDAVLELHSHKTNKKKILEELKKTLSLGKPVEKDTTDDIERLTLLRDQLNEYCDVVNEPIGTSKMNFINALGYALQSHSEEIESLCFDFEPMSKWSSTEFRSLRTKVEELDRHLDVMGNPSANPFHASQLTEFLPSQQRPLKTLLEECEEVTAALIAKSSELAEVVGLDAPETYSDVNQLGSAAQALKQSPDMDGVDVSISNWEKEGKVIPTLIGAGKFLAQAHKKFDPFLIDAAWEYDVLEVRQHYMVFGKKWWKFLSGKFRKANRALQGLSKQPLPKSADDVVAMIDAILESQKCQKVLEDHGETGKQFLGEKWNGIQSDWQALEGIVKWVFDFHNGIRAEKIPKTLKPFSSDEFDRAMLAAHTFELKKVCKRHQSSCKECAEFLQLKLSEEALSDWNLTLEKQARYIRRWASDLEKLSQHVRFNNLCADFEKSGLSFILPGLLKWSHAPKKLVQLFDFSWYQGLVEAAYTSSPAIKMFDKTNHESKIAEFSRLDKLLFRHNQLKLVQQHWEDLPNSSGAGEMGILNREMNKKRSHIPIRKLITSAGNVLLSIKPVFMMSPMSIATYIPASTIQFDLVVFDEASQVKPVDAFGAMLRGRQAVVVGDSKQLPPTSFFDSLTTVDYDEEEEDAENLGDLESILSLFLAKGAPSKMLRWHYRSRHDSLISVSNNEFYDNKLMIFPSSRMQSEARGLSIKHFPETTYDRGKTRTNLEEAKAVAQGVMRHAQEFPDQTLGVVAFSMAQREAIEMQLEILRRTDASCEPYFSENEIEPFFIKNLENVQGDERDVIFISIGYGKTTEGYMTMSFGPLNKDGGERRLNVLITRSRLSMVVFSNFTSKEIDLGRTKARGVVALKNFLAYAETGIVEQPYSTEKEPDSPFEEEVIKALVQNGVEVEPQIGTSGFFIDIGIKDAANPGRYIMGIECDGATYHSSRSARDRDRLRQEVLENLGWRLYRVWSTDWYRNRAGETERLLSAIQERQQAVNVGETVAAESDDDDPGVYEIERTDEGGDDSDGVAMAYVQEFVDIGLGTKELHELPVQKIFGYVFEIVKTESPVHEVVVMNRISEGAGLKRTGNRIKAAVSNAIEFGVEAGDVRQLGEFIWDSGMAEPSIRDRSDLEGISKKYEYIPPEELRLAIMHVVKTSYSISHAHTISETIRLLGFQRITSQSKEIFDEQIEYLTGRGKIVLKNDLYSVADG